MTTIAITGGAIALVLLVWLAATNARAASLPVDDPAALARTHSLGRVIKEAANQPVHIVFVHGMRAEGPGTAQKLMAGLCRHAPVTCPRKSDFTRVARQPIDLGPWPSQATISGRPIWRTQADWEAGQPFVDRYLFPREGRPPVVVDEVNWWPLLFPLKCAQLVAPEAKLSGVDKAHLDLCMCSDPPYHPWLTRAEYDDALEGPKVSGGGALGNAYAKQQLMNWGLSDAVIALGPMRGLFRKTMDGAFAYAAAFENRDLAGQQFVVVSESLGSFVVMDAADNAHGDSPKAQQVVSQTLDLYFFANQFALLELGRIKDLQPPAVRMDAAQAVVETPPEASPTDMLEHWAAPQAGLRPLATAARPKQIIAFSDPSDVLTYAVPHLLNADGSEAAIVANVYDRNEIDWFGLFADPITAHTGHSGNDKVLGLMFRP